MNAKSPPLIEYRNITVIRNDRRVLDRISLCVNQGEHIAILGPNGAGKSSLIKTITRELYPLEQNSGSYLRIMGKDRWNVAELRDKLGIVSSEVTRSAFFDFSCEDIVLSGFFSSIGIWPYHHVTPAMKKKANEVMDLMGILHLRKASVNEVSSGEQRLVIIGRALVNDPPTMLLDEPTSSLDLQAAYKLRGIIRKLAGAGKSILMITHNLSDVIPEIQRVVFIREGRIVRDGKKETVLTADGLSELFGVKLDVARRDGYYYCW